MRGHPILPPPPAGPPLNPGARVRTCPGPHSSGESAHTGQIRNNCACQVPGLGPRLILTTVRRAGYVFSAPFDRRETEVQKSEGHPRPLGPGPRGEHTNSSGCLYTTAPSLRSDPQISSQGSQGPGIKCLSPSPTVLPAHVPARDHLLWLRSGSKTAHACTPALGPRGHAEPCQPYGGAQP